MEAADNHIYDALHNYTRALDVALGHRDMLTRLHSSRVHDLSLMIGQRYGLDSDELAALELASSFHDIGKIGIPDSILMKPAGLDADEWVVMKRHSEIGEQILLSSRLSGHRLNAAARAIRHHHEHFNGDGYPDGLSGKAIPLLSRIIAIADSYDAMAVPRAYNVPRNHREIMTVMQGEIGMKFEPELMEIFCDDIEYSLLRVS